MTKFVHISDPHLSSDYSGQNIMLLYEKTGVLPTEQFKTGMEHINRNHSDIGFFILTGDVVQDGTAEEYAHFRRYIECCMGGKPCYAIPGNHDSDAFLEGWYGSQKKNTCDYIITDEKSGLRIIGLDSRGGPYGSGILDEGQLEWLRESVKAEKPCIILMHHTPHIGDNEYLTYQMQNPLEFYKAVNGSGVLGIFAGHTHIRFESYLGSIPCFTAPGMTFGLIVEGHTMTATDATGYNYCSFSQGVLTVDSIDIPGTGAKASLDFGQLKTD